MTPEQLILLMETSSRQYISMEAKINVTGYIQENDEQIIHGVYEIITRWSQDKEYWKISQTIYPTANNPKEYEEVVTYSFTPEKTKQLNEQPGKTPRGLIRFGGKRDTDQSFYTIHTVLWENCDFLWTKLHDQRDMSLKYDKMNHLYEFRIQTCDSDDSVYTFYVDPARKYIPVKKDYFARNAHLKHFECNQFQEVNDVWIPYNYFLKDLQQNQMECYEVEQVSANIPIDDRQFDFDFPIGTIIIDEMAYLKHKLNMK
jgi:hypothetical protein